MNQTWQSHQTAKRADKTVKNKEGRAGEDKHNVSDGAETLSRQTTEQCKNKRLVRHPPRTLRSLWQTSMEWQ